MEIRTNNVPRWIIYGHELSNKEKQDFDYLDDIDSAEFFRFKKHVYALSEFMRTGNNEDFKDWDGYASDSYFSGVLIKLVNGNEAVIVAQYFS